MREAEDLLRKAIARLEIPSGDQQIGAFLKYLSELKKWNMAYNLTGLKTDRQIIIRHFMDSLLFLKVLPGSVDTIADVGSGAGFPGIPMKIVSPDLTIFLIEPSFKKSEFLRHICRTLGLSKIHVLEKRIEDAGGLKVDAAVTRALFSIGDFLRNTRRILNESGVAILNKGPRFKEELEGLDRKKIVITDFELPFEKITRHLVAVRL